ncbi:hypothetical protein KO481_40600 [Nocardia sp. NEAU-G5]|uniref:Uncharacterized protein n=1 Tax=Nocardia albiluteola TaxID=2842303 RepID=A0ABS6BBY7_9NOCA|nr:hypothetical protein [Nocardia albiluteola]MBU3067806.1 hypothetical protein [Nocardia albiluteola]
MQGRVLVGAGQADVQQLGDVKPAKYPPGRGMLVSRSRDRELIQICQLPPV